MSFLGPRIPVSIHLYREETGITFEPPRRRASPTLIKRRSVSSMKGLLPLALPSSRSASPSQVPSEDAMEDKVDCYLPEVLARDLEISSDVFAAKALTSGTPAPSIKFSDDTKPRSMSCPSRIQISACHSATTRVQKLWPIEERESLVSFLDQREFVTVDDQVSDLESLTGTESSLGAVSVSMQPREHSIITTATSLTSTCDAAPSPTTVITSSPSRAGHTWIDMDSEDDNMDEPPANDDTPMALSPRPPTPSDSDPAPGFTETTRKKKTLSRPQIPPRKLHHISGSISDASIEIPHRQSSIKSSERNSLRRPDHVLGMATDGSRDTIPESSWPGLDRHGKHGSPNPSLPISELTAPLPPYRDPDPDDDDLLGLDHDLILAEKSSKSLQQQGVFIQPSPPPSPLPTVQAWLDGANEPFAFHPPAENLAKVVPLPPDITETLRVSIACFPETMLLTSSLTVETIRAYSRKVRHTSHDPWLDGLIDRPITTSPRSIWKKVVSRGHSSSSRSHRHHGNTDGGVTPNSGEAANPWQALVNVFGNCSDYICDALYAHIIAYNYMSRIPRSQTPMQIKRESRASSMHSQKEEIPKKAASVLGLSGSSPEPTSAPTPAPVPGRLTRKLSSSMMMSSWGNAGRDSHQTVSQPQPQPPPPPSAQDLATRNIQAGLLRCIVRLIATAQAMAEGGDVEHRMVDADGRDVDVYLTRSLCEMVRISEEAF